MAQTITDYDSFLTDAIDAVKELGELKKREEGLLQEYQRLTKSLEMEKKAAADEISSTVKRRAGEINNSYDQEITKGQDKLKKIRGKREKAKNQGVKDRIEEETAELCEHNRELQVRMKSLFQQSHVPAFCRSGLYYSLYLTKGFKEAMIFLATVLICFLLIPCGIYALLPNRQPFYLAAIYFITVVVFGGLYVLVNNLTKGRHLEALREGRSIRNVMISNKKKIRVIAATIRKDKNEEIYNLERYDDEIAQLEQDLAQLVKKKKEALSTFENVTKTIISDEIMDTHIKQIKDLEEDCRETERQMKYTETLIKEKKIFITDNYEVYTGKEFLSAERLQELKGIIVRGEAGNISEAIAVYRNSKK